MGGFLCIHLNNHVSLSACLCASQSVISSLNESTLEVKVCPPIPLPSSRHTNKHRHTFIHKTFTTSLPETTESSENCSELKKKLFKSTVPEKCYMCFRLPVLCCIYRSSKTSILPLSHSHSQHDLAFKCFKTKLGQDGFYCIF